MRVPAGPCEDDEARLRADRLERLLEAGVAHVEDGRRDGERRGHLLEPARRVRATLGVGLGATSLHLLERQARLVGESADDRERRLVGLGHDDLPRDREDELAGSGDDDRRPQRRADPELADEVEPFAVRRLQDIRHERRAQSLDRLSQAREVVEAEVRLDDVGTRRVDREQVEPLVPNPPEDAVVRAEGRSGLPADDAHHVVCVLSEEPRSDEEDAVERAPELALGLVQARTLERLSREVGDDARERERVAVERRLAARRGTRSSR